MLFEIIGGNTKPVVLFFHAMGVTGASCERTARYLRENYCCILPTSTVYCAGQKYRGKADEVRQIESFLSAQGIKNLALVVASSLGADLAAAFLSQTKRSVGHVFFDGGQFAQIGKGTRLLMTPFVYLCIKSLYWTEGKTLKKILWCDKAEIKPYFIAAGKALKFTSLYRQLSDSLEKKPFPALPKDLEKNTYFAFGSQEEHFRYRDAVMKAYPESHFPIFEGYNHMQYFIQDPKGFADMLVSVMEKNCLPNLPFLKAGTDSE